MRYLVTTASQWALGIFAMCVLLGVATGALGGSWHVGPATSADLARLSHGQRCLQADIFTACAPLPK